MLTIRQQLEFRLARLASNLSPRAQILLSGGRRKEVDGLVLEPELQLALALVERGARLQIPDVPVDQARQQARDASAVAAGPPPVVAHVRDLVIDGAAGPLDARLYSALDGSPAVGARTAPDATMPNTVRNTSPDMCAGDPASGRPPLLVFFHGGGFVLGGLDTHDVMCRMLARGTGSHVLAVDYRLAPEHPFPAAKDDAIAAFRWAVANAEGLGADPHRAWVAGDSAGGALSTFVARETALAEEQEPCLQLLFYPVVDLSDEWMSRKLFADGYFLTERMINWFGRQFLGPRPEAWGDPGSLFGGAQDLSGLAPAIVVTAGFDPLRDEGEDYAANLAQAGVPTVLRRFDGLIHGFANMTGISTASRDAVIESAGMARVILAQANGVMRPMIRVDDGVGR